MIEAGQWITSIKAKSDCDWTLRLEVLGDPLQNLCAGSGCKEGHDVARQDGSVKEFSFAMGLEIHRR